MSFVLKVKPVKQLVNYCGPACVRMILSMFGISEDQKTLGEKCNITKDGVAPSAIIRCLKQYKIKSYYRRNVGEKYTIDDYLNKYQSPIIIGTESHYMIIVGYTDKLYIIVDPEIGKQISMPKTVVHALIKDMLIITGRKKHVIKHS